MKVLFFCTCSRVSPHFETELELMKLHREDGDKVFVMEGIDTLEAPTERLPDAYRKYFESRFRFDNGMQNIGISKDKIFTVCDKVEFAFSSIKYPSSMEDLQKLKIYDFDLGQGIASTLISFFRDVQVDVQKYSVRFEKMLRDALRVYESTIKILNRIKPDRCYVFNGRFHDARAFFRACLQQGVDCYTHERGAVYGKYTLYKNSFPHDLDIIEEQIQDCWEGRDDGKGEVARIWYQEKKQGGGIKEACFTQAQNPQMLPNDFDTKKHNIVFFNSCYDEVAAVWDTLSPLYNTEEEAVLDILKSIKASGSSDYHLYFRVHPNLENSNKTQVKEIERLSRLQSDIFTVIPSSSPVDSYALLDHADVVVTFGSTMGAEAAYWGKPSILLAYAAYQSLNCCYVPSNRTEVMKTVCDRTLPPKPVIGGLQYGYWRADNGIPFKYYNALGYYHGLFEGKRLVPKYHWKNLFLKGLEVVERWKKVQ